MDSSVETKDIDGLVEFLVLLAGGGDDVRSDIKKIAALLPKMPAKQQTLEVIADLLPPNSRAKAALMRRVEDSAGYGHLFADGLIADAPVLPTATAEVTAFVGRLLAAGLAVDDVKQFLHASIDRLVDGTIAARFRQS